MTRMDSGEWEKVLDPMAIPLPPDYSQMVNKPLVERPGPFPSQLSPEADTVTRIFMAYTMVRILN